MIYFKNIIKTDQKQVKTHQIDYINFKRLAQSKSINQLQAHQHISLLLKMRKSKFKKQIIVQFLPK